MSNRFSNGSLVPSYRVVDFGNPVYSIACVAHGGLRRRPSVGDKHLPTGILSVDAHNNLDHGRWQHDHIGTKCASHSGTTYVVFKDAPKEYDFPRFLTVHDEFKQMGMGVASRVSKGIKPPISHANLTRLCGGCISYSSCAVVVGCVRSMFGSFFHRV